MLTGPACLENVHDECNGRRVMENLRMQRSTFLSISDILVANGLLVAGRDVSVNKKMAIFINIVGLGSSNRQAQEQFQRSGQTISRYLCSFLFFAQHPG